MKVVDKFKNFVLKYLCVIRQFTLIVLIPLILLEAVWYTVKYVPRDLWYRLNSDLIEWKRYWNEK